MAAISTWVRVMSDPMTNLEIEDVLSSIRRLVSEELRPAPRVIPVAAPEQAAGKLVLTPAYRVQTEDEIESLILAEDTVPEDAILFEALPDGHAIAEPAAAVPADVAATPVVPEPASETPHEPLRDSLSSLEATISELEAAVAARQEDWEPDGSEAPAFTLNFPASSRASADAGEAADEALPAEPPLRRLHLGAALPPSEDADDAVIWLTESEDLRARAATPQDEPAEVEFEAGAELFDEEEDSVLDEGMLRELVIEIIRQELQGALGERITRNVRKLVRAEIHRAMASREFD